MTLLRGKAADSVVLPTLVKVAFCRLAPFYAFPLACVAVDRPAMLASVAKTSCEA